MLSYTFDSGDLCGYSAVGVAIIIDTGKQLMWLGLPGCVADIEFSFIIIITS